MTEQTLHLYIGAQKTASTLVSNTLKTNLPQMQAHGIGLINRTQVMASPFFTFLKRYPAEGARPMPSRGQRADLKALLVRDGTPHMLATSEGMFSSLAIDDFFQNIAPGLRMLKALLPKHRLHVILYVRHQRSFVESCYTQLVQMGNGGLDFPDYLGGNGLPMHLDWARVCDDIAGVIGRENLSVSPFETIRSLGGERFVRNFLSFLGLDEAQIDSFDFDPKLMDGASANRGFSAHAVQIARFTMPLLQPADRKKLRRFLQKNFSTRQFPRPAYFTKAQAAAMTRIYAESNARLFRDYMPEEDPAACGYL